MGETCPTEGSGTGEEEEEEEEEESYIEDAEEEEEERVDDSNSVFVSVNSNDTKNCGTREKPCKNINTAVSMVGSDASKVIRLMDGTHSKDTTHIDILTNTISITRDGTESSPILSVSLDLYMVLFNITTGTLCQKHFTIDLVNISGNIYSIRSTGTLSLSQMTIYSSNSNLMLSIGLIDGYNGSSIFCRDSSRVTLTIITRSLYH